VLVGCSLAPIPRCLYVCHPYYTVTLLSSIARCQVFAIHAWFQFAIQLHVRDLPLPTRCKKPVYQGSTFRLLLTLTSLVMGVIDLHPFALTSVLGHRSAPLLDHFKCMPLLFLSSSPFLFMARSSSGKITKAPECSPHGPTARPVALSRIQVKGEFPHSLSLTNQIRPPPTLSNQSPVVIPKPI
jgi:hypothetical protein